MSELSLVDAINLGKVIHAVMNRRNVRWIDDDGDIREGVLRGFVRGATDFNFFHTGDGDIRDAYIWITSGGMERIITVRCAVDLERDGEIAFDK